jgi:sortase A
MLAITRLIGVVWRYPPEGWTWNQLDRQIRDRCCDRRQQRAAARQAFNETIATGHLTKPWPWADIWPVARIEVKRIHASAIALAGSSDQALAFGPGHVERTPDAGERGVAVYSAHRDTHFSFLREVAIGDEIDIVRSDGSKFRYRADATSVVRFDRSGIDPLANGYELVLSTCWPFDALTPGPDRYLLHATMTEPGS